MIRPVDALCERGNVVPDFLGPRTPPRRHAHHLVVADRVDANLVAAEQPLAGVDNFLEHRRRVRHRLADCAQYVRRGLLLLERLLRLVEEARVLDRDQRLITEGLGLDDFARAKNIGPPSADREQPDAFVAAQSAAGTAPS